MQLVKIEVHVAGWCRHGRLMWRLKRGSMWLAKIGVDVADPTCMGPTWVDVAIALGINL